MFTQAFEVLRGLGYREREVRPVLKKVRTEMPPDADLDTAVRAALRAMPFSGVKEAVVECTGGVRSGGVR